MVPYVMIAAFPAPIRFSGISFSYNLAYAVFGGLTPIVVTWLLRFDRLAPAHFVGALCLIAVLRPLRFGMTIPIGRARLAEAREKIISPRSG
jgi:hypothetical protein